ncbi:hypothetical protein PVAP13_5NG141481 [Panicum virgatum]|uniref:Uncharacterized protein n=1 Tax=Panicum virgatum TaxID=38727 RepID=A0A8T0RT25_PANVG|nr:hypothetical protein PVAP13_5NG141481 [Panicum virgatum]
MASPARAAPGTTAAPPPQYGRCRPPRRCGRVSTSSPVGLAGALARAPPGQAVAVARAPPCASASTTGPAWSCLPLPRLLLRSAGGLCQGASPQRPDLVRPHPLLLLYSIAAPPGPPSLRVRLRAGEWPLRQHVLPPLYTPVASTASVAAVFVVGLPLHLRQPPCFTFSIPLRTVRPQQVRLSGTEGGLAVPPPPWIL